MQLNNVFIENRKMCKRESTCIMGVVYEEKIRQRKLRYLSLGKPLDAEL